tara:strand:- start:4824 stop:5753 length:930 start_codon:yes stop_codon:yes gene_type:complete
MIYKRIFYILFIIFLTTNIARSNNIFISTTIDGQIITNIDIENEIEYLKILNPNLMELNKKQLIEISKESLINEIIKKKEIVKVIEFDQENSFTKDYIKNLYSKLNFETEKDFNRYLKAKKNYSLDQIKQKIKIEILWNELIYLRFKDQIRINKRSMLEKIKLIPDRISQEYLLSEIVFEKKKDEKLKSLIDKIKLSILEIGFNNTANIYSISESAKFGGEIGWVLENNLSEEIYKNLKEIEEGQFTKVIQIGNNYLILKIEKIKTSKISLKDDEELEKMIKFETNKQLNQFSRIFFNKAKLNYTINEN